VIFLIKGKPLFSTFILTIICIIISAYFFTQIFQGKYAIANLEKKKQELKQLILKYEHNQISQKELDQRIKSLDPQSLDIDILEEEMRKKLLLVNKNELLIIHKK
jgi:cell division protein FtsB